MREMLNKREGGPLLISENPLIYSVYKERNESPKRILGKGLEIVAEREVERRYLPARLVSPKELYGMPGAFARTIEQKYVWAAKSEKKKDQKKLVRFRLRKTHMLSRGGKVEKEEAFRIAYKRKSKKNPNARFEVQRVIRDDPETYDEQRAFLRLWQQGETPGSMTRFYIPHTFVRVVKEDGRLVKKICNCQIHYEIRRTPQHLLGFVRIEIEFQSDDDEEYARKNKRVLPDWIGEDVTDDKRYKSAALQSDGLPEEAKQLMLELGAR